MNHDAATADAAQSPPRWPHSIALLLSACVACAQWPLTWIWPIGSAHGSLSPAFTVPAPALLLAISACHLVYGAWRRITPAADLLDWCCLSLVGLSLTLGILLGSTPLQIATLAALPTLLLSCRLSVGQLGLAGVCRLLWPLLAAVFLFNTACTLLLPEGRGVFGNINWLTADMLALALLLLQSALVCGLRQSRLILLAALLSLAFAALWWHTQTRATLLVLPLLAILALFILRPRSRLPLALSLAALAVLATWILRDPPFPFLAQIVEQDVRGPLMADTCRMIADRPLTGWGPDQFQASYGPYFSPEHKAKAQVAAIIEHPHNEILRYGAELGLAGAALLLALFAIPFAAAAKMQRLSLGGLAAAAIFLHALMDKPLAFGAGIFLSALALALSLAVAAPSPSRRQPPLWLAAGLTLFITALALPGILQLSSSSWHLRAAKDAYQNNLPQQGLARLQFAAAASPDHIEAHFELARRYILGLRDPAAAEAPLQRCLNLDPSHSNLTELHAQYCQLLAERASSAEKAQHLNQAATLFVQSVREQPYDLYRRHSELKFLGQAQAPATIIATKDADLRELIRTKAAIARRSFSLPPIAWPASSQDYAALSRGLKSPLWYDLALEQEAAALDTAIPGYTRLAVHPSDLDYLQALRQLHATLHDWPHSNSLQDEAQALLRLLPAPAPDAQEPVALAYATRIAQALLSRGILSAYSCHAGQAQLELARAGQSYTLLLPHSAHTTDTASPLVLEDAPLLALRNDAALALLASLEPSLERPLPSTRLALSRALFGPQLQLHLTIFNPPSPP